MFDECLGYPVMQHILSSRVGQGLNIALITDKFKSGVIDDTWIPQIASEGAWVVITSDKGKQPRDKCKLPRLCLEYGVTHILVSQTIGKMKASAKCDAVGFAWDRIMKVGDYPEGARYSMKLANFKNEMNCGIILDLVEPNTKGNNVVATLTANSATQS